jgi:hypothetical protein
VKAGLDLPQDPARIAFSHLKDDCIDEIESNLPARFVGWLVRGLFRIEINHDSRICPSATSSNDASIVQGAAAAKIVSVLIDVVEIPQFFQMR